MKQEGSASFLKKRSKKLLVLGALEGARRLSPPAGGLNRRAPSKAPRTKSFFATFFSKKVVLTCLCLLASPAFAQMVQRDGVTLTQAQETRAEAIGDQLRCLVCQNESIEGSSATLAHQLRVIIRQHVVAGDSDQSIMAFMVQRYGIFVLLKPPFSPLTFLLYASPFLALVLGFGAFFLARKSAPPPPPPLTESDRARLEKLTES